MRIVRVSTHLCGADIDIAVLLDDNDVLRGSKLAQIGVTNECRSRPMRALETAAVRQAVDQRFHERSARRRLAEV
jgi:hypothetical protein